ncbi:PBECR3 domain-containing polyvalent protein, partial [Helicobacter felis]|uniref:PBECR3 domain-containing polyvalent protein n=1 Tax=Helicobacter felis TaxID=214 RepID=UPI0013150EA2
KASRDITLLNNIDAHKSFFSLFKASDPKEKERYENAVKNVLQAAGFEGAAFKDGHIYGTKGDKTYRINENFFDNFQTHILSNAGTLAGSIVGAAQGASRGLPGAIIGGALGAGLGAGLDHALSNYTLNREQNFSDMARHMIEQGSLNVVGDALFLGGAKAISTLGKHADTLRRGASAVAGYIPGIGMTQRFLNGNVKAAQEVLAEVYTPEQEQALKEFAKNFGGELSIDAKSTPLAQKVKNAFGEDSKTYKAYQNIEDIFRLSKQSEQQEAFIRAIRADDSGTLLAFMSEAANSSPRAHNTLKGILNKTTRNLEAQLEQLHLNPADIKAIFEDLDKGTRQSYTEATQRIIPEVLEGFKTTLEPSKVKNIYKELEEQGFMLEARPFLKHIENNIYNPEGVSFTQLNNALKTLNSHAKHASNPGLKDYIRNTTQNIFRHDIKEGIDDLFSQLPEEIGKKYQELYHTTLKDYATMKETLKMVDGGGLKLRDAKRSEAKALEGLLKYAQGQGEAGLDNLTRLSKGLSPANREVLELNMLDRLFKSSLLENDGLRVFDSQAFFKRLEGLKEGTFSSQASKDFIDIASGFNRLFNQDAKIAAALKANTGEQVGSSIATSVSGAVQYQVTKALFGLVVRTMPHIPFAKSINSKVSQAALRYHIKAALNKSVSVGDFKQHLRALGQRVEFDNATKALIREIEGGLPPDDMPPDSGGGGMLPPKSEGDKAPSADDGGGLEGVKGGEKRNLTPQEIKEAIEQWDLSPEANANTKQRLVVSSVDTAEAQELGQALKFKGKRELVREIDAHQVLHTLKQHGDANKEASRGQIAVTLEDIAHYQEYLKNPDFKHIQEESGRIVYAKQINGYAVVIEEALSGQDKLRFFDMWKLKGQLNKEVLLSHSQRPNTTPSLDLEGHMPSSGTNPTTPELKNQEGTDLPTKSTLKEELSPQEIKSHIEQWDLTNPKATDRLLIGKVEGKELEQLSQEFKFNGNYALARQIDSKHVAHVMNRHSNPKIETSRNQIPITMEDIANYPNIVKSADIREVEGNRIRYKKQINGHYVVIEEALTKKNKISFVTMWKSKGDIATPRTPSSMGYDLDRTLSRGYQDDPTTPPLKKPSIREQALAFRQEQKRREQEALEAKEAKYKAERQEQEQAYQASLAQKESQAGTKENQKDLKLGTPIAMQRLQGRSSSVSLDDEHIYPLDFVVVKTQDVKPSFNTGVGTQTRTQTNSKMVEQIAQNFKPEMVLNRGGFDDLPLILSDGQVIAGNHRAKGMQNFTPQSRHTYEQAILEHYGLELKGDELLVRTPKNELDTQEIINLASASNKERAHTYGDKLIAALGKYDSKITPDNLENYLKQSHDVQELAQNVGRALDTQAKEPDIEGANLALLAQSARNTQDYTLSKALNDAQKTLDIEDFSKLKEMLVKNAGSFYTLLRDSRLPNLHLAPYLTQSIPSMAHALKTTRQENFTKLYEDLSALLKTTDEHGINALVKMNPEVYDAMASELLGASLARFVRLKNPAQSFYEFLKNAHKG